MAKPHLTYFFLNIIDNEQFIYIKIAKVLIQWIQFTPYSLLTKAASDCSEKPIFFCVLGLINYTTYFKNQNPSKKLHSIKFT